MLIDDVVLKPAPDIIRGRAKCGSRKEKPQPGCARLLRTHQVCTWRLTSGWLINAPKKSWIFPRNSYCDATIGVHRGISESSIVRMFVRELPWRTWTADIYWNKIQGTAKQRRTKQRRTKSSGRFVWQPFEFTSKPWILQSRSGSWKSRGIWTEQRKSNFYSGSARIISSRWWFSLSSSCSVCWVTPWWSPS